MKSLVLPLILLVNYVHAGMITGSYTGNGSATQAITGLGSSPDVVLVKADATPQAWIATSSMASGNAKDLTASNSGLSTGLISSIDADGFTVAQSGGLSNETGVVYYYVAWEDDASIDVSSFTPGSTGVHSESLGYRPSMVWLFGAGTSWYEVHPGQFLMDGQSSTNVFTFSSGGSIATASYKVLSSITATGFNTTSATTSASHSGPNVGTTYYYVAFNAGGNDEIGQYAGENDAGKDVTLGVEPDFIMVKNTAGTDNTWFKTDKMETSESFKFGNEAASTINVTGISDSPKQFSVGSSGEVNGSNTYDYYVTKSLTALPVDLIAFNGEKTDNGHRIYWKTGSEINSSHFVLERSLDGENFESIGFIQAAGYSTTVLNYEFYDENPSRGNNYYRLIQVDNDGTTYIKRIIVINSESGNQLTRLIAYEVDNELNIDYASSKNPVLIEVFNNLGQSMYLAEVNSESPTVHYNLPLTDFSKGIYWVRVLNSAGEVSTVKLALTK